MSRNRITELHEAWFLVLRHLQIVSIKAELNKIHIVSNHIPVNTCSFQ